MWRKFSRLKKPMPVSPVNVAAADVLASDAAGVLASGPVFCTLKPSLDLQKDYFSVFGLLPSCDIDPAVLSATYRSLQQLVHPDRFTRECDRTQRLALQQAAHVNAAYETLKSPLNRAQYLLQLAGIQRPAETTTRDHAFLLEQLQLREQLEDAADDMDALDRLLAEVRSGVAVQSQVFAAAWQQENWPLAEASVDKLQFMSKLMQQIEERQERLLD